MKFHTTNHGKWNGQEQWTAIDLDTYDGAEDAGSFRTMGCGASAEDAISDLLQQFEDGKPWQQEYVAAWRSAANDKA